MPGDDNGDDGASDEEEEVQETDPLVQMEEAAPTAAETMAPSTSTRNKFSIAHDDIEDGRLVDFFTDCEDINESDLVQLYQLPQW